MNKERYDEFLKRDNTGEYDYERKSLFYICSQNEDLYKKIDGIYDFEEREIIFLEESANDYCSSSQEMIKLAFNLFNSQNKQDISSLFSVLDKTNMSICLTAINLKFSSNEIIEIESQMAKL